MTVKRMKKAIAIIMTLVMLMSTTITTINAIPPEEMGYIPIRVFFEDITGTVTWQEEERSIHIKLGEETVILHTQRPMAVINGIDTPLQDGIMLWQNTAFISIYDLQIIFGAKSVINEDLDFVDIAGSFMLKFATGDILGMMNMMTPDLQAQQEEIFGILSFMHQIAMIQMGNFHDWEKTGYEEIDDLLVFEFAVNTEIGKAGYIVAVTERGEIAEFLDLGFQFIPVAVDENNPFSAYPITVGKDTPWPLDGLLTMPHDASEDNPVPAVVLVHGSGPQNMDSSVFGNRPFNDIASFLSSNGIATLRYNKRTHTHGAALLQAYNSNNFTVQQESVEDALLAVEILRADPRISRIYVLGLSLGGTLAPLIAEEGGLDGAILMAAFARPMYEVSHDQSVQSINDALAAGLISQEEADEWFTELDALLEEAGALQGLATEEMQMYGPDGLPLAWLIFGQPAIYQRSVIDALPIPIITRNAIPTLILQGSRDWQVSAEIDFQRFIDYLGEYDHVTTRLYIGLNHLFMLSLTEYNDLRDYMPSGHVDEKVLMGIVDWINKTSA